MDNACRYSKSLRNTSSFFNGNINIYLTKKTKNQTDATLKFNQDEVKILNQGEPEYKEKKKTTF